MTITSRKAGLTPDYKRGNNHLNVTPSVALVVVSLILVPYIALSAVAPEHVHEPDADHHQPAVHRHVQPHTVASHDGDHVELADDDDHIVWLDNATLHQPGYEFAAPALSPGERFESAPAISEWASPPDYDTAPPHGPPRACLSLRAPPSFPA